MPGHLFHLQLHSSRNCVFVSQHVFPSSVIFIQIFAIFLCMFSIFTAIYLCASFFFYNFNRHICNGDYWCTHNLAHILILRFPVHFHFCDAYVCVRQFAYALPYSSIPMHIYRHIDMYACFDYSVIMTLYKIYTPIIISFCVPAAKGQSRAHVWMSTSCMRGNKIRITRIHNEIYNKTHKQKLTTWMTCYFICN